MSFSKKTLTFAIVGIFSMLPVFGTLVHAQTSNTQNGGSGLQLSPTRTDISVNRGETKKFSVTIKNVTKGEVEAQVVLNDFVSDNTSGNPSIIIDDKKDSTAYSLKNMITNLTPVRLKPNETKQIENTVNVPVSAAPGAYFGALRYAAIPVTSDGNVDETKRQVSLTASVAHLVFLEVPGEITQKISVNDVSVLNAKNKKVNFWETPKNVSITVENLGNGFARPFGTVSVEKSSKVISKYDLNNKDPKAIVLPRSKRIFTDGISGVKMPGKYTVVAGIAYGNGGEVVNVKKSFWYLPLWFVAILAAVVILLVVGGYLLYRRKAGNVSGGRRR